MLVWLSVWSEVQIVCIWSSWCHCISKRRRLLPHFNPDRFYLSGTGLSKLSCKNKGSPYSITEHRVPELIAVLGSQPAGDVSHKPGGRLPLLSARPAVTPATLKKAATNFAAWQTEAWWMWTVCLRMLPSSIVAAIWTQTLLCLSPACKPLGYRASLEKMPLNGWSSSSCLAVSREVKSRHYLGVLLAEETEGESMRGCLVGGPDDDTPLNSAAHIDHYHYHFTHEHTLTHTHTHTHTPI